MSEHDERPPTVVVQPAQGVVSVAADTIGALRSTPLLLVMVILNCAFLAAAAYYLRVQQDNAYKLVGSILEHCLPASNAPRFTAPSTDHQG